MEVQDTLFNYLKVILETREFCLLGPVYISNLSRGGVSLNISI